MENIHRQNIKKKNFHPQQFHVSHSSFQTSPQQHHKETIRFNFVNFVKKKIEK